MMREHADRADAVFFIDPPYTAGNKKAGRRLYKHSKLDHEELFRVTSTIKGDFLMTYDADDNVSALAEMHGFATRLVPMKSTHHAEMAELLIGRDLKCGRRLDTPLHKSLDTAEIPRLRTRLLSTVRRPAQGSGQFRVKMHAKPQLIIFQSIRDAKILWFSCGVFDTLVGAS